MKHLILILALTIGAFAICDQSEANLDKQIDKYNTSHTDNDMQFVLLLTLRNDTCMSKHRHTIVINKLKNLETRMTALEARSSSHKTPSYTQTSKPAVSAIGLHSSDIGTGY